MKKVLLLILLITMFLGLSAVEKSRDEMNKMFMSRLDVKLTQVTKVLGVYNDSQQKMKDVKNLEYYNDFLYKMTLEVGKVRKVIIDSETQNVKDRSDAVSIAISSIKADVQYDFDKYISPAQNTNNKVFLTEISGIFHQRLIAVRKAKLNIEQGIAKSRVLPYQYMDLLSQEFIYSYALAFMDISSYLNESDRDYLVTIINSLIDEIDRKNAQKN